MAESSGDSVKQAPAKSVSGSPPPVKEKKIALRKTSTLGTPSIKDALHGKFGEETISAKDQHKMYTNSDESEDFSPEDLHQKWVQFLSRLEERPNLRSTLSTVPEIQDDYKLYLEIENRIQEDLITGIKPELVSWLRKELRNSKIELVTIITEKVKGRLIYTDAEKFDELTKKNPDLALLKQTFKLDFGG